MKKTMKSPSLRDVHMQENKRESYSVRILPDHREALRIIAFQENKSRQTIIDEMFNNYIDQYNETLTHDNNPQIENVSKKRG